MPPPFYSPNLALDCSGNYCSTINWGQQAHVPTHHDSPLLYYTRYTDCGNGIIQYDMAMHHFGQVPSDIYSYFSTPWTAVRTSVFRDMMIANPSGRLEHYFPMDTFDKQLRNLDTTGGFTTFAQDLTLTSDVFNYAFCVNTSKVLPDVANTDCVANKANIVPFVFKVRAGGVNAVQTGLNIPYGLNYTVAMNLCNLSAPVRLGSSGWGNPYDGVVLTNDRTGFKFQSKFIIHYCWQDNRSHMDSSVTAEVLNRELQTGDTLSVKYVTSGKRFDDQLALTLVHGINDEYTRGSVADPSFFRAKSRMRFGTTNNHRDGTVWTTNLLGILKPSETYFARKFMIADSLHKMEATALPLSDEAYEDVIALDEVNEGETIKLWMNSSSFGASIGSDTCANDKSVLACVGSSTPKAGFRPLFHIVCGTDKVTAFNPYQFAVFEKQDIFDELNKKPYLCLGKSEATRAKWKLLGFFASNCTGVGAREYQSTFCQGPVPPSMAPSSKPTLAMACDIGGKCSRHKLFSRCMNTLGKMVDQICCCSDIATNTGCKLTAAATCTAPVPCFSGKNTLRELNKGMILMEHVTIGDMIEVDRDIYDRVYSFGHKTHIHNAEYLQIYTNNTNPALEISSDHLLFVKRDDRRYAVPASTIRVGESLFLSLNDDHICRVERIKSVSRVGAFAPFTGRGTIVVNGIVSSSYVALQTDAENFSIGSFSTPFTLHWLSHSLLAYRRIFCRIRVDFCNRETYGSEGVVDWIAIPLKFSRWIYGSGAVVQMIALVILLVSVVLLGIAEAITFHPASTLLVLSLVSGLSFLCLHFVKYCRIRHTKTKDD